VSINNILNTYSRPTIRFDAAVAEHRYWAYRFIKHRTWAGCPFVFALPMSEDNVYNMILRLMSEYYTEQEFGGVAEMPQMEKVVPITAVDKRTA
jgi:hypothetical protein